MQTIVNLGTGGADLNGQNGSTTSADSNDALFLDWPGDNAGNYVYLPGASGNYLSVPDEAALDITGDIDLRAKVAMDDWTPAANTRLVSKLAASGTFSYEFSLLTTGVLQLTLSSNGTTAAARNSTVATSLVDGSVQWVRATLDADNGASGHDVQFFTSNDGLTWTQLGATVTNAGTFTIHSGTAPVAVGSRATGVEGLAAGKVYRAQVLNGIDGTPVLDVDCSQIASGSATSFTALTGQTVSINRSTSGRKAVAVVSPVWLFGTDDRMQVADNALLNFDATQSFTVVAMLRQWDSPSSARIISKEVSGTGVEWYLRNRDNDEYDAAVSDGTTTVERRYAWLSDDLNVLAMVVDRDAQTLQLIDTAGSSATPSIASVGSLVNTHTLGIGAFSTSGFNNDMELLGVAVFRRALTAAEISQIVSYYQNKAA